MNTTIKAQGIFFNINRQIKKQKKIHIILHPDISHPLLKKHQHQQQKRQDKKQTYEDKTGQDKRGQDKTRPDSHPFNPHFLPIHTKDMKTST